MRPRLPAAPRSSAGSAILPTPWRSPRERRPRPFLGDDQPRPPTAPPKPSAVLDDHTPADPWAAASMHCSRSADARSTAAFEDARAWPSASTSGWTSQPPPIAPTSERIDCQHEESPFTKRAVPGISRSPPPVGPTPPRCVHLPCTREASLVRAPPGFPATSGRCAPHIARRAWCPPCLPAHHAPSRHDSRSRPRGHLTRTPGSSDQARTPVTHARRSRIHVRSNARRRTVRRARRVHDTCRRSHPSTLPASG